MDTIQHPDLVFDVGAHKGEDSDFYLNLGYRVVAVEANPKLADELRERFQTALDGEDMSLVDRAIGQTDGVISFFVNKVQSVWGTVLTVSLCDDHGGGIRHWSCRQAVSGKTVVCIITVPTIGPVARRTVNSQIRSRRAEDSSDRHRQ